MAVVGLGGYLVRQGREVPLDAAHCPVDRNYPAQIAILLDPSDPLNAPQSFVVDRIDSAIDREMPEKGEIKTFTVARAGRQDTVWQLRQCKPVHLDSIPWNERAAVNPRMIREAYEDFRDELGSHLGDVLQEEGEETSPILEALQTAVLSAFRPREAATPRWLLIVSDMLQNSENWTFYGPNPNPVSFPELSRDPILRSLRMDLTGVRVTVYQLARQGGPGRIQQRDLRQFWDDYFRDMGADPPTWVDVEG